ncbi:MAG: uncharacterized protein JWN95_595 [Frankiales bacterium]|nr:uncharacterized protein [Frankiales bacterium]
MRWDALFADLEGQASMAREAERAVEVGEQTRILLGSLSWQDRVAALVRSQVRLACRGRLDLVGEIYRVGAGWLLLQDGNRREFVVPLEAIQVLSIQEASRNRAGAVGADSRLGMGHALRGIARDRSAVVVHCADGSIIDGTLDRVAADFIELARHPGSEFRRRDAVRETACIAWNALSAIQRST